MKRQDQRAAGHQVTPCAVVLFGLELRWLTRAEAYCRRVMAANLDLVVGCAVALLAWSAICAIGVAWPVATRAVFAWDMGACVLMAHGLRHFLLLQRPWIAATPPHLWEGEWVVVTTMVLGPLLSLVDLVSDGWVGHVQWPQDLRHYLAVVTIGLAVIMSLARYTRQGGWRALLAPA